MTTAESVEAIERDRRDREAAILLLLLALARRARIQVNAALRLGANWTSGLRDAFLGNPDLDLPGGVELVAALIAEARRAGTMRAAILAGVVLPDDALPLYDPGLYRATAREALAASVSTLEEKIAAALRDAVATDRISADLAAAKQAFGSAGWLPENPFGARVASSVIVLREFGNGMAMGYAHPLVAPDVKGLRYVAVLDGRTTVMCWRFNGVTLPENHPWWDSHWPPNHFDCRSIVLPAVGEVRFTLEPPWDPMPEFGFGIREPRKAA